MKNPLSVMREIRAKLALWGWRGAVGWILRKFRRDPVEKALLRNASYRPGRTPEPGVTVVGPLSATGSSLQKVLRDFAAKLGDAGVPCQTFDTATAAAGSSGFRATPPAEFDIRRFTHAVGMISCPVPDGLVRRRGRMAFWEFNEGFPEAYTSFGRCKDDIIALSDFNARYFRKEFGDCRVIQIPYPLRIDVSGVPDAAECRRRFGFAEDAFVVFYNFGWASGWNRKNPHGAVRAFARAFRSDPEAKLVFKTFGRAGHEAREAELLAIAEKEGVRDKIVLFNDWMSRSELQALANVGDVYLSLHRAEGFGLGAAEAMCLSKAVVATDYSSTTEFCRPETSVPVPFRLVPVKEEGKEGIWLRGARLWAEPDLDAAADALRRLYHDRDLRLGLGAAARAFVNEKYSTENFRKAVEEWLASGSAKEN